MNATKLPIQLIWIGLATIGASLVSAQSLNGFDLSRATIPVNEIHQGGPPRDGIPAIDAPVFWSVDRADRFLRADDEVISFEYGGEVRAYPLRILVWHEIVNDTVGGQPVAVTYCPLCGTSMVFGRTFGSDATTFGVSGLLYQSDVLMYDRATESLWSQLKMEAVSGPYAGASLDWLPSQMMSWQAWKAAHPAGRVLSPETGHRRNYQQMPYAGYEDNPRVMFPIPRLRDDLAVKTWVVGVLLDGKAHAFALAAIEAHRGWQGEIAGTQVVVRFANDAVEVVNQATGETLPHVLAYWFAWQAFYPETTLWEGEPS